MPRYRANGRLDDPTFEDGDFSFQGMDSRRQSTTLEPGMVAYSQNMRLDKFSAIPRKGISRLSEGISLAQSALILPFVMPDFQAINTLSESANVGTVSISGGHGYLTNYTVEIKDASISGYNTTQSLITVTSPSLFTYSVTGPLSTEDPTNAQVAHRRIIKNTYDDGIFTSGVFADDGNNNKEYICLATGSSAFFVDPDSPANPIEVSYTGSESIDSNDKVSLVQVLDKMLLLRGQNKTPLIFDGDLSTPSDFELVPTSALTADPLNAEAGTVAGTIGTKNVTGTGTFFKDNLYSGQRIKIDGNYYFVDSITDDTSLKVTNNLLTTFSGDTLYKGLDRLTLLPMQNSNFGLYYQNRLILPYPSSESSEIIMSDILDIETYDPAQTQFKFNSGGGDSIVGFSPYKEDELIVFQRKSIHKITGLSGSLDDTTQKEITREVGCIARKSIVNIGNRIFFLSTSGVYSLEDGFEHKLRGYAEPLSKPIDDQIANINGSYASLSSGIYFNNRYYLAAPVGDDATKNNQVFVYNLLNNKWESTDTYPSSIEIDDFQIADYNGERRLFVTSFSGVLNLLEENEADQVAAATNAEIDGEIITRQYTGKSSDIKRWNRVQIDAEMDNTEAFTVTGLLRDPDSETTPVSISQSGVTDDSIRRMRLKKRGYALSLKINTTAGRPEIKSAVVEGTTNYRGTRTFE